MTSLHTTLSKSIEQEAAKLLHCIDQLPHSEFRIKNYEGTGGAVSIADILAYQIGWTTLVIQWYENGIAHQTFSMPGEGFATWDYTNIALHFYKKYENYSYNDLIKTFSILVTAIISIVEKEYVSGNLDAIGVWSWCTLQSGKQWPLSKWIQVNTVAPYKRAQLIIKKGIKSKKK